ncbi:MAG: hypothetical protein K2N34_14260, partial [Lachnospiraceae bacterium]|nr:hypothetical protein [Lachnospiraceae bacterium]
MEKNIDFELEDYIIDYYVVFKGSEASNESENGAILVIDPIVDHDKLGGHLFDSEMEGIIPALNFILHLPKDLMDAMDINVELAYFAYKNRLNLPHNIIILPSDYLNMIDEMRRHSGHNAFLFYEDVSEEEVAKLDRNDYIDIVPVSKLSNERLKECWHLLGEKARAFREESYPVQFEIFSGDRICLLPALFVANHLGTSKKIFELNDTGIEVYKKAYSFLYNAYIHIQYIYEIETKQGVDKEACLSELQRSTTLPIVLSMMGRPVYQKRLGGQKTQLISQVERDVCRFISTHRACAIGGAVIEIEDVPNELFILLEQMETHCRGTISNNYIWNMLNKLGRKLLDHIGVERAYGIRCASHITAFTDFPIGLAILPGYSAPLCCYVPISYRPITPLTRALQIESVKMRSHYIRHKCKIIVAECIDPSDPIWSISRGGWKLLNEKNTPNMTVIVEDINSIAALKKFSNDNLDADILIISAHGAYSKKKNLAGLYIGKELWFGEDNDLKLPPLVMLSSCHANPRGTGSVNVSDLLLRAGAMAVIGSFIPVDVFKNMLLFSRFVAYIQAALEGDKVIKTVIDAWSWVVASNAVNEIVGSNETLKMWMMRRRKNGRYPIEEFMLSRSKSRLHQHNIYDDTIKILREMLSEDGMGEYFDAVLNTQSFFPESLFYQVLGAPENIYLYNELYD